MSSANRQGQVTRYRDRRYVQTQANLNQFEVYLEAHPIFRPELVTEHPPGARLLPMGIQPEGLYQYPRGQGVVYLDAWQLQLRTVQPSARKPPPRKRRKCDEYTSLIVQHWMKEKPNMLPDVEDLREADEARAYQQPGPFPPVRERAELGDNAAIIRLLDVANDFHNQADLFNMQAAQLRKIAGELKQPALILHDRAASCAADAEEQVFWAGQMMDVVKKWRQNESA